MKKFSKTLTLGLIALLMIAALSACTNTYNGANVPSPSPSVPPVINPLSSPSGLPLTSGTPGIGTSPNPSEQPVTPTLSNQESAALASRCDTRIARVSEIDGSVTILVGDQSLSGVTFASAYKGALTDRIKGIVADCVKEVASSVRASTVTNSPDAYQRIAQLRDKQQQGGDPNDIKQEFEDIKNAIK